MHTISRSTTAVVTYLTLVIVLRDSMFILLKARRYCPGAEFEDRFWTGYASSGFASGRARGWSGKGE
jgi:hypothetical protein